MQSARNLWGAVVSVHAGAKLLRGVLMLGLLAAGGQWARAEKLARAACKQLENELAYVLKTGARDDMVQGPAWAKTNLTNERLQNVKRLIELEEQLEFRCDMRHSGVVAITPKQRPVTPEAPPRKPETAGDATHATTATQPPSTPQQSESVKTEPDKIAKDDAEAVKERAEVVDVDAKKDARTAAGAVNKAGGAPKKAATTRPAPSHPATKNAYVSPTEVNPFFVTRYGNPR